MAINTYATLKTAVANWLGRSDLTARIPEFITLAEADINRNLRREVVIADFPITPDVGHEQSDALPSDCAELRLVRYKEANRKYALTEVTVETLADMRRVGSGIPCFYAVADDMLMFDVLPNTSFGLELVYFAKLVPLEEEEDTNATLTNSPDIYLFGALKEAEPYLEHDERVALWEAKYNKAVADENIARERAELGAAPKVRRLPVVFG